MMSTNQLLSRGRLPIISMIAVLIAACTLQDQTAPGISGPSELGLGMSLTAAPEVLPRDGSSMSTITAKTFDSNGKPLPGQRLSLSATAGVLTVSEVVTGADGSATFTYIAPGLNENVSSVAIFATPVQNTNIINANSRIVEIQVNGPSVPVTFFSFTPAAPAQFQLVTFDGSGSSLGGSPCGSACSFAWDFGDGTTGTGMTTQHRFTSQGAFFVTLTVTSPSGTFRSQTRTVNVGSPIAPTAAFTFSPTNPEIGDTVFFNGAASTAVNGATIVEYRWDLGNGVVVTTATPTTSTTYAIDRAFRVRLTVLDSNGLTGFVDQTVTVSVP